MEDSTANKESQESKEDEEATQRELNRFEQPSNVTIDKDLKLKFKSFFTEGETNKIKRTINNFLLEIDYKTFEERKAISLELMKLNKKYKHAKLEEISKIVDSIISNNEKIKALTA